MDCHVAYAPRNDVIARSVSDVAIHIILFDVPV